MIQEAISSILIFSLVQLLIALSNLLLCRPLEKTPRKGALSSEEAPLISILVPARNEEDNIRGCVESLLSQRYPRCIC